VSSVVIILLVGGLMHAARSFRYADEASSVGTLVTFGYLLLTAFLAGGIFERLRLPRLTGYIIVGLVVGPSALGLVSSRAVDSLQIFSGIAVALIALTAGTELELRAMRPLFRTIAWMTLLAVCGTTVLLAGAVFLSRDWLPFMAGMTTVQAASFAALLGVVMVAQSPAVVVAMRKELDAEGPVASTVLGVVVIADLVVILLFAVTSALVEPQFGHGGRQGVVPALAWELLGSLVAGVLIGVLLAVFLRVVRGGAALFVLTVCFVVAEVGRRLHLDPLLVALAAGIFIRNTTDVGDRLHEGIEGSSLPVYVIFFAVAGASIPVGVLAAVGAPALVLVAVRAAGFGAGTAVAARLARAPDVVGKWASFGLLSQAGLALALASLFGKMFPQFGTDAGALILAVVAINQIFAPALYRLALVRAGETNRAGPSSVGSGVADPVTDG
jgi:Kef-type K+ transport system membrane component KefB